MGGILAIGSGGKSYGPTFLRDLQGATLSISFLFTQMYPEKGMVTKICAFLLRRVSRQIGFYTIKVCAMIEPSSCLQFEDGSKSAKCSDNPNDPDRHTHCIISRLLPFLIGNHLCLQADLQL